MENGLPKISWNDTATDEEAAAIRKIIKLGRLLARLRGVVPTWETQATQGSDYSYHIPTIEEPGRAITQLRNLARGHTLSKGRNYITLDDIPLIIKVVLSTAPIERATIFDILISHKGSLTTSEITKSLNITPHTAHRTMTELSALGLVDSTGLTEKSNAKKKITLKPEFSWFLSEEFQMLRESFDYEEEEQQRPHEQQEAETEHEEKNPLSSQKNEDVTATEETQNSIVEEHEEKSPPTNDNLDSDNQQLEELEEKILSNSDDNLNLPTTDLNTGSEPRKLKIKFTPDYNEKEPVFWRVIASYL